MTLDELCTRRVAVWGLGQEGLAVTRLLVGRGVLPVLIDDRDLDASIRPVTETDGGIPVSDPGQVIWSDIDVVVRSPGVSRYRAELAEAEAAGVIVTTSMAIWLDDFRDAPVLAVTGTKGKSTTAALAASILEHEGLDVVLAGNIGAPVMDLYGRPPADAYVVEVSSYQAADVTISPAVCVLTSLAPDHLDWHGGEEAYYRDKLRLVTAGPTGALAVNAGSAESLRRTGDHPHRVLFGRTGSVRVDPSGWILVDGEAIVDTSRLRTVGDHNVTNLCGAIAGVLLLRGESPSSGAVAVAVDAFDGLASRCRIVGQRAGLTVVDDALASNPFATEASARAFAGRELTVIVGGADRGVDLGSLTDTLASQVPRPNVVVLPPDPDRFAAALRASAERVGGPGGGTDGVTDGGVLRVTTANDIEEATAIALATTAAGGVVLFSPAAPTPHGEGSYRERSRRFIAATGIEA